MKNLLHFRNFQIDENFSRRSLSASDVRVMKQKKKRVPYQPGIHFSSALSCESQGRGRVSLCVKF